MISKKILPEDKIWLDRRLINIWHTQFAYRTDPATSLEQWRNQRDFTKFQVAMAAGLKPAPKRTELKTIISEQHRFEGTIISAVSFESMPGSKVTGTLYMPERVKSQAPGILCPNGHTDNGRIHTDPLNNTPLFCQMMARLGFIVFSYDMPGYNDNCDIMHKWTDTMRRKAALSGVSPFGIQTCNSLRALDFLCDLPEVDERRIGAVGHGGGAFQAMVAALLDERIKVLAISGFLSSYSQGNCECEQGPLLRINGITSFDILSACAPRPLFIASTTQDCTSQNPTYEVPALQEIYNLLDSGDALLNYHQDIPHGCPRVTREHIYPWLTHWLLNQSLRENIIEDDLKPAGEKILLNEGQYTPDPTSTQNAIEKISRYLCANATPMPKTATAAAALRKERIRLAGDIINSEQNLHDIACRVTNIEWSANGAIAKGRLISRRDTCDIIPAVELIPSKRNADRPDVLLVSGIGKQDFFSGGNYSTLTDSLINAGCRCWTIDMLGCGETSNMLELSYRDEEDSHFYAFNQALFSMRTQDILTALQLIRESGATSIAVISAASASKQVLCAISQADDLETAVIDMNETSDSADAWLAPLDFQPMIFKLGGMKGLATLAGTKSLGFFNPNDDFEKYVRDFYSIASPEKHVYFSRDTFQRLAEQLIIH